jgi:hypothetical protein
VFWLSSQKARDLFLGLFFNHEFTRNNGEKEKGRKGDRKKIED